MRKLYETKLPSAVYWLACLPLDPRMTDSNPAEDDGFVMTIKSVARLSSEGK
jgi:hypothetical protein